MDLETNINYEENIFDDDSCEYQDELSKNEKLFSKIAFDTVQIDVPSGNSRHTPQIKAVIGTELMNEQRQLKQILASVVKRDQKRRSALANDLGRAAQGGGL